MRMAAAARILAVLALGAGLAVAQTATTETHRIAVPDKLTWGPPPPGLPSGSQLAVLDGDPTKPHHFVVRLRMPDGYTVKPHWHSQDEHITVMSGRFEMGMGDQMSKNVTPGVPGTYFSVPGGHRHFATARGETVVQIDGQGPFDIFYVNPSDDPRLKRAVR